MESVCRLEENCSCVLPVDLAPMQGRCNRERPILLELLLLDVGQKTPDNCWCSLVLGNFR